MKWVLMVILISPSGELHKIMNGGKGWENRIDCRTVVEAVHEDIVASVKDYYENFTDETQVLGVGCYQPMTNQEDMVIIFE